MLWKTGDQAKVTITASDFGCDCDCQVAAEPDLAPLLSELVDNSDGQEIYLRRPERYGLDSNKPTSFSHVG